MLLVDHPKRTRAWGLSVSINGSKPLTLMLDTGAGGILITGKAAEKARLKKLSDIKIGGLGDQGESEAWVANADKIQIGGATYANQRIRVAEKKMLSNDEDGLIGSDVFSDFLVTLDFFNRRLVLDPLPGGMPSRARTWDREISPALKGFSPVFRLGHLLLIQTRINDSAPVLFIIDSGGFDTIITKKVAQAATKVRSDSQLGVKGLSGKVEQVARAQEMTIHFAGFQQRNQEVVTLDLDRLSKDEGIEIGGVLGLPLLSQFRSVTLDYRDGLVKFDYKDR